MNAPMKGLTLLLAAGLVLAAGSACAADTRGPVTPDNAGATAPGAGPKPEGAQGPASGLKIKPHDYSAAWDLIDNSVFRPIARATDPALISRKLAGQPREAANVDENDQVRLPSTWWQPRIGFRTVTVQQMLDGPGHEVPAPGVWTITSAKTQGVTPGFNIKDRTGTKFVIKFDPLKYPEMASGAEVIGTCLFWAAGYNVPDNSIQVFRPESLEVAPDATTRDKFGRERRLTAAMVAQELTRIPRRRDGTIRCLASKYLSGKPIGPIKYNGRRKSDPEDLIPHELRRELRGLWTMAAFTNHSDIRGGNTLDMLVTDGGRTFVRHYLIDFGSLLGSSALGPREYPTGTEYYVDYGVMGRQFATLGLHSFKWEDVVDPHIPAVGFIESKDFDAKHWRPDYPNPAFDERTERDIRWGARIVAGFTDAHIRAAVQQAQFSDPAATEYLVRVLIERRDKLVTQWLGAKPELARTAP
jgi:hypothetical protein